MSSKTTAAQKARMQSFFAKATRINDKTAPVLTDEEQEIMDLFAVGQFWEPRRVAKLDYADDYTLTDAFYCE